MNTFKQRLAEWLEKRRIEDREPMPPGSGFTDDLGRHRDQELDEKDKDKPWLMNQVEKIKFAIEEAKKKKC